MVYYVDFQYDLLNIQTSSGLLGIVHYNLLIQSYLFDSFGQQFFSTQVKTSGPMGPGCSLLLFDH